MVKALSHARNQTGCSELSVATYARVSGTQERHIQRALASLSVCGILPVVHAGGGRNKAAVRMAQMQYADRSNGVNQTPAQDAVDSPLNPGARCQGNGDETPASDAILFPETPASRDTNPGKWPRNPGARYHPNHDEPR